MSATVSLLSATKTMQRLCEVACSWLSAGSLSAMLSMLCISCGSGARQLPVLGTSSSQFERSRAWVDLFSLNIFLRRTRLARVLSFRPVLPFHPTIKKCCNCWLVSVPSIHNAP